ncbi:hypothetical protein ACQ4PT_014192 [Festuca glaucescens]
MLSAVEGTERLRVFRADMAEEGSFDDAITGCAALFHVAASMDLHLAPDQHDVEERARSHVLEPATRGTIVLRSCVRAGTIRRVVFTSSVYILSKRLAEEAAFGFARENGIRLVSVVLPTVAGPFLTPAVPTSVQLLLSPVTRDPKLHALLASVHARFGCVPLAHVFHMDAPAAHGRYLCAGGSHQMAHRSNPQKGN